MPGYHPYQESFNVGGGGDLPPYTPQQLADYIYGMPRDELKSTSMDEIQRQASAKVADDLRNKLHRRRVANEVLPRELEKIQQLKGEAETLEKLKGYYRMEKLIRDMIEREKNR